MRNIQFKKPKLPSKSLQIGENSFFSSPQGGDITLYSGMDTQGNQSTIRLSPTGFYVNEQLVPVGVRQAAAVYEGFKAFLKGCGQNV